MEETFTEFELKYLGKFPTDDSTTEEKIKFNLYLEDVMYWRNKSTEDHYF